MTTRLLALILILIDFQMVLGQDTLSSSLPFAIHDSKRISEEDLKHKKEGIYATGIPQFAYDPINKFSFGVQGTLFQDGKRTDPFFAFTPYRYRIDILLNRSSKDQQSYNITTDIPFVFNTKWRLRGNLGYYKSPNTLFFGADEKTLNGLSYYPNDDSTKELITNAKFNDYANSLSGDKANYNVYIEEFYYFNAVMEHSYFEGRLRVLGGIEMDLVNMYTNPGKSRLQDYAKAGKISGMGQTATILYQAGMVYDTRDLETDPGNGIFAEATNELTIKGFGSPFTMDKVFIQGKFYKKILPQMFNKVVFAARIGIGGTMGDAPFWEIQPNWSSELPVFGLPLRGYKSYRFLGNIMNFANFELRARFVQFKILKQHIALSAVPIFEVGAVFDKVSHLDRWTNYRYSYGFGGRIAWNVNTILRFDYSISQEDNQFFFAIGNFF